MPLEYLVGFVPAMKPRLYSIAVRPPLGAFKRPKLPRSKSVFYGAFVWACTRALDLTAKNGGFRPGQRWFPARAVGGRDVPGPHPSTSASSSRTGRTTLASSAGEQSTWSNKAQQHYHPGPEWGRNKR
jgi:hypothetical protein